MNLRSQVNIISENRPSHDCEHCFASLYRFKYFSIIRHNGYKAE